MKYAVKIIVLLCVLFSPIILNANQVLYKRHVLALYDSTELEDASVDNSLIHSYAEVILNHLGLIVDYHDINIGLPAQDTMKKYRGIITWFQDNHIPKAHEYALWVEYQIKDGKKMVILGDYGAYEDELGNFVDSEILDRVFSLFGVEYLGDETSNSYIIDLVCKDPKMVEFERKLDMELNYYVHLKTVNENNKVYLKLKRTDRENSESALAFTCNAGGIVCQGYEYYLNLNDYKTKWRINPFLYFREAFGVPVIPIPDVTTHFGSRIFFSHIDGDAFISISQVYPNKLCSEVIIDEILKKYLLPTSVSVVVGELIIGEELPWIKNKKDLKAIARDMYNIPYIEPASHGYTHPLHWQNKITAITIPGYSVLIDSEMNSVLEDTVYESLTMDMSIIDVSEEEMIRQEIGGAIGYINDNLIEDPSKKAEIFFWTGNCVPMHEALAFCKENGIRSINGGDPIFDEENNSYSFLCPIKRFSTQGEQFYTAACNENIYTNLWNGPFYGFRNLIETFRRTESPVRIKPANIYYHFYSGERKSSLSALKENYDFVLQEEYIPVPVSKYMDIAHDWFQTRVFFLGRDGYAIENNGVCQTVRFDNCNRYPDFKRSKGVIGYLHYQGSLYIHLDENSRREVFLTDQPAEEVFLRCSTGEISGWKASNGNLLFFISGVGRVGFTISNLLENSSYDIDFNGEIFSEKSDSEGNLKVLLSENPIVKTESPVSIIIGIGIGSNED